MSSSAESSPLSSVVLRLVPGLRYGSLVREPAEDIPPGPVLAEAPLYPDATPTSQEQPRPFFTYPGSPYLKSGTAASLLPIDRDTAMAWYRQVMPDWGYRETARGHLLHHSEPQSEGIGFDSLNVPGLTVYISFQALAASQTHALYVALMDTLPRRPPESHLNPDIEEIELIYRRPLAAVPADRKEIYFTVQDKHALQDLIMEINALTDIMAGISTGRRDTGESATLICRGRDSEETRVEARMSGFVTVDESRTLVDMHMRVWRVIVRLVHQAGY